MSLEKRKISGKQILGDLFFYLFGSVIYAVSINSFTAPNQIAPGGITGLSTMMNYLFHTPIGVLIICFNVPILVWAIFEIGYRLVTRTIVAIVVSSVIIDLLGLVLPVYSGNRMLASIFGGVLEGVALSMFFIRGATTGGTDMIARLLQRHFPHISTGKLMLAVDALIVLLSAVVYRNIESMLYALITIFVSTKLIDVILYGTNIGTGKIMFIISEKNEEISNAIMEELERGVTALQSKGAYTGRENEVLLCAVRRHEVHKVHEIVNRIDPDTFVIVGEAGEIAGEGFRRRGTEDKTLTQLMKSRKK